MRRRFPVRYGISATAAAGTHAARRVRVLVLAGALLASAACAAQAFEPELIERLPGAIDDHTLVLLDGHRAVVAWERDDGVGHETVWSSRRSTAGAWSVPEILEFSQGRARSIELAALAGGAVLALWVQDELALEGLWSNRYDPGSGWRQPSRIEPVGGELYAPSVALDANGMGWAVWERRQGSRLTLRASRYTPDGGWQTPLTIDTGDGDALSPQVAVHADGSAVLAWTRMRGFDGNRGRIMSSRFAPATGWQAPRAVSAGGGDAHGHRIVMDGAGNVIAVWQQNAGEVQSVFASRFDRRSGWDAPQQLELPGEEAFGPRIAVDVEGNVTAIWIRADGESGSVVAARHAGAYAWQAPVVVQGGRLLRPFDLDVAAGREVLAVWCQTDGARNNVWFARSDAHGRWQPAVLAEHRTGSAHRPRAAATRDGALALIWKTVDAPLPRQALYSLWFRRIR